MSLARSRTRAALAVAGACALATMLEGCASGSREVLTLRIPGLNAKPVLRLSWIDNYPRAIATIAYIIEKDLDLPPVDASLRFYSSREGLAEVLVASGYDATAAAEITASIGALAADGNIILNESALIDQPWSQRIAVLAHELTHAVQYQLAGGRRGTSDQWLREGFSEYVSVRVLERLEVTTLTRARFGRMRHIRKAAPLPALSALASSDQWLAVGAHGDSAAMYPYAFVAVDLLVQQHGTAKVLNYFRLFAFTDDRDWAFRTAFGQDIASFERTLRARLQPPPRRSAMMER